MELHREERDDGGAEVTLRLTPREADALKGDEVLLLRWLSRGLEGMADWRTGQEREEWWPVIADTSRLIRRLEGVRDAAVRDSPPATTSANLARWLGRKPSTVQSRRAQGTLPPTALSPEEGWARTGDATVLPRWSSLSGRATRDNTDDEGAER